MFTKCAWCLDFSRALGRRWADCHWHGQCCQVHWWTQACQRAKEPMSNQPLGTCTCWQLKLNNMDTPSNGHGYCIPSHLLITWAPPPMSWILSALQTLMSFSVPWSSRLHILLYTPFPDHEPPNTVCWKNFTKIVPRFGNSFETESSRLNLVGSC